MSFTDTKEVVNEKGEKEEVEYPVIKPLPLRFEDSQRVLMWVK
jgi:hypothetical protein